MYTKQVFFYVRATHPQGNVAWVRKSKSTPLTHEFDCGSAYSSNGEAVTDIQERLQRRFPCWSFEIFRRDNIDDRGNVVVTVKERVLARPNQVRRCSK